MNFSLSFVREPKDINMLKDYLVAKGSEAKVIAKIEDQQAISNLDEIIKTADGLMVARGDLGVECSFEELPSIQSKAIEISINETKPVIVATQMLESMIDSPCPHEPKSVTLLTQFASRRTASCSQARPP